MERSSSPVGRVTSAGPPAPNSTTPPPAHSPSRQHGLGPGLANRNPVAGGTVLVAGGDTDVCSAYSCSFAGSIASAELYEPSTRTFTATADMPAPRALHQATMINHGRV